VKGVVFTLLYYSCEVHELISFSTDPLDTHLGKVVQVKQGLTCGLQLAFSPPVSNHCGHLLFSLFAAVAMETVSLIRACPFVYKHTPLHTIRYLATVYKLARTGIE